VTAAPTFGILRGLYVPHFYLRLFGAARFRGFFVCRHFIRSLQPALRDRTAAQVSALLLSAAGPALRVAPIRLNATLCLTTAIQLRTALRLCSTLSDATTAAFGIFFRAEILDFHWLFIVFLVGHNLFVFLFLGWLLGVGCTEEQSMSAADRLFWNQIIQTDHFVFRTHRLSI
jgi:hypothetical protein